VFERQRDGYRAPITNARRAKLSPFEAEGTSFPPPWQHPRRCTSACPGGGIPPACNWGLHQPAGPESTRSEQPRNDAESSPYPALPTGVLLRIPCDSTSPMALPVPAWGMGGSDVPSTTPSPSNSLAASEGSGALELEDMGFVGDLWADFDRVVPPDERSPRSPVAHDCDRSVCTGDVRCKRGSQLRLGECASGGVWSCVWDEALRLSWVVELICRRW
jgi:hypothetical protein